MTTLLYTLTASCDDDKTHRHLDIGALLVRTKKLLESARAGDVVVIDVGKVRDDQIVDLPLD